jgi:hypothetical protein
MRTGSTGRFESMCGSELHSLPEGVQRVSRVLQDAGHPPFPPQCSTTPAARRSRRPMRSAYRWGRSPRASSFAARATTRRCWSSPRRQARGRKKGRCAHRQDRPRRRRLREGAHRLHHRRRVARGARATKPVVLIDRELFRFEDIWAAAGHPHAVFQLRPQDLENAHRRAGGGRGLNFTDAEGTGRARGGRAAICPKTFLRRARRCAAWTA